MPQKKCFKCSRELPLSEFYKAKGMADGHFGKCKECTRADVSANRAKRIDQYRTYDVARAKTPKRRRLAMRIMREYRHGNPERYQANTAVNNALRDGRLVKQPCEVCGRLDVHGHHDDYSKPLGVRWLCPVHHKEHHDKLTLHDA